MRKAVALDGQGRLAISTLKEGGRYIDGCVRTRGKFEHTFGYYVARIEFQRQLGHWSAFWLYNAGVGRIGNEGRDGTEIDIMEKPWLDERINYALHWDGYGKEHKSIGTSNIYVQPDRDGFITTGLLWTPGSAVLYCNGRVVARWDNARVSRVPAYPILYMVTGGWDNSPLDDAQLPADLAIDYVRIWQRADLAAGAP
jgi:beta-glucanase (GH16 family)